MNLFAVRLYPAYESDYTEEYFYRRKKDAISSVKTDLQNIVSRQKYIEVFKVTKAGEILYYII